MRSGQFIKQLSGYTAFLPSNLPPEPPVDFSEALQLQLSQADRDKLWNPVERLVN